MTVPATFQRRYYFSYFFLFRVNESRLLVVYPAVLELKMSHSMRNYGDETNDKNSNSLRTVGRRGQQKPHCQHLGVSRRTIIRWSQAIEKHGSLDAFLEHYQQAKKGTHRKRKTDAILKRRIWALREKHHQCCGQKIQYFLEKEYDTKVSVPTIYKVLSEKYQLRSKWQKNKLRGSIPEARAARQVIQMDPVFFGEVFAFTAVDIFTKESEVLLRSA